MVYIDIKTVSYNELKNLKASEVLQFEQPINENIDKQKLINKMFLRIMCRDTFQINAYKDNIGNIHLLNGQDEFHVIADLINENIESVEKDFKLFFGREYKLMSISPKEWEEARNKYIANLKNGYKYTMMDDSIIIEENTSELEKLANEIFGNNYEIK